jgi:AcrR family transcriptional regulator
MMNDEELKRFKIKLAIADSAAQVYVDQNGSFNLHQAARKAGLNVGTILEYFNNKQDIIYFFYAAMVKRYRLMIEEIEGFGEFTLSEKLSNFAYTSFDMLAEHETFVKETFNRYILCSCKKTAYESNIEDLLTDFIKNDPGRSVSSDLMVTKCSIRLIRKKYLHLVKFWLNDKSEDKQVSMELTDKITGLIEEALYTSVIDRSFDLAKFLFSNETISGHVPLWDKVASRFEIK